MSNIVITKDNNNYLPHLNNNDDFVYGNIKLSDIKSAKINTTNKEILISSFGEKKIRDLDGNFAGERLKATINLTIFESGFKVDNISDLIIMVIKDIFTDFGNLTVSEIGIALRKGVRGELGEFMGLSVRTFYIWIKTYSESIRLEAMKSLNAITIEEPKNEEKIKQTRKNWLISFIKDFESYKITKRSENFDINNYFYEYCITNNIASLTREEKLEIKEKAKRSIIVEHNPITAKNSREMKDFKQIVRDVLDNSDSVKTKVINESKRIAITYIYDKLIDAGVELKDLIKQIEPDI